MKENLSIRTIQYEEKTITYRLERKAVKNVNLHIYANETIYVSAPAGVPSQDIDTFLYSKGKFILRALEKYRQKNVQKPPLCYTSGESVPVLGKDKILVVKQSPAAGCDDDDSHVYLFPLNVDDFHEANPGLCDSGPLLSAGQVVYLPELPPPTQRETVQLWD